MTFGVTYLGNSGLHRWCLCKNIVEFFIVLEFLVANRAMVTRFVGVGE